MNEQPKRGSIEHCLAQGRYAKSLMKRFEQVVGDEDMVLVRYWFEELYQKAEMYLRTGHELVNLGVQRSGSWNALPYMLFNPTEWNGPRRILIGRTASFDPCIWVGIEAHSVPRPSAPAANAQAKQAMRPTSTRREPVPA